MVPTSVTAERKLREDERMIVRQSNRIQGLRVRTQGVRCLLAAAVAGWLLSCTARAQEEDAATPPEGASAPAESKNGSMLIRQAYARSEKAINVEDLTQAIDLCLQGLEDANLSKAMRDYGRKLLAWTHDKRGLAFDEQGDLQRAMADFDESIRLDPSRWQAVHNRGVSFARQGQYDMAIADFDRTIELNPNYANAYFNRGELHYELGKFRRAIADYNQCLRRQPRDSAAYNSRGHAYYRIGNYRSAVSDYNQSIRIDPNNAAAYTNRGDSYADVGSYRQAAQDYRSAIRVDPKLGRAYQSAAWLMATCPDERYRETEKAVNAARRAVELDGEDYRYLDTLAAAYANAGDFEKAREIETRAVEAAPEELATRYKTRLRLYEQNQPYRDQLPNGRQNISSRGGRRS